MMIRMPRRNIFAAPAAAFASLLAAACSSYETADAPAAESAKAAGADIAALEAIVAARADEDKARDQWRHPVETLAFFGLAPDDHVVEVLPGRGWYTKIILPYVAENGRFAGVIYQYEMFPLILPDPTEETLTRIKAWTQTFPGQAAEWAKTPEPVSAFEFGDMPQDLAGSADAVLIIRALHNFNRAGGDFRDVAIADAYAMLKPGGVLGVVQHRAPEAATGAAGDGSNGYLKQSDVIVMMEEAGFVFEEASEINANPADQAGPEDIVWRLAPSLALGETDRDAYLAIGESDRMTLRFRKPAA